MASLTPDQSFLFDKLGIRHRRPSGSQTPEQARNPNIASFQCVCEVEGVGLPTEADVLADLALPPSKIDPALVEALYVFPSGEGPFGPKRLSDGRGSLLAERVQSEPRRYSRRRAT